MTTKSLNSQQCLFAEVLPQTKDEAVKPPTFILALVVAVEPRHCGLLIKKLSADLPLANRDADLSHLKRVKRTSLTSDNEQGDTLESAGLDQPSGPTDPFDNQSKKKRRRIVAKKAIQLEVVLGAVSVLESKFGWQATETTRTIDLSSFAADIPLGRIRTVMVPARLAESEDEWKDFNTNYWPTVYFPNKTKEFLEQEMQLTDAEIDQMIHGMEEAIGDSVQCQQQLKSSEPAKNTSYEATSVAGVVVVCPKTGLVVASASNERELQRRFLPDNVPPNPLSTPILLAIQGVSRLERQAAVSMGGMLSESFQRGQYLCTGYDVYSTLEPTVFEAMALVHSRIRRLVFGRKNDCGGVTDAQVHALPGTNHHYRSFACRQGSDLWERCASFHHE